MYIMCIGKTTLVNALVHKLNVYVFGIEKVARCVMRDKNYSRDDVN